MKDVVGGLLNLGARWPIFDTAVLIIRGGPGEMEGENLARTIPTSNPDHGSNKLNHKEKSKPQTLKLFQS